MKLLKIRIFGVILLSGFVMSSCGKDDDVIEDDAEIAGSWTLASTDLNAMVGNKTLSAYLVEDAGYGVIEAQLAIVVFKRVVEDSFAGDLQLKSDNTYTSNLGGENETGTWSLSSDRKQLTIDPDSDVPSTMEVKELTSGSLKLEGSKTVSEDLNKDAVPETIDVDYILNFRR